MRSFGGTSVARDDAGRPRIYGARVPPDFAGYRVFDLVIDSGPCNGQVTTIVDLSGEAPRLVREGAGDIRPFGFVKAALH